MGHWTIKLGQQNGRLFQWPKCSCVSTNAKLWKLLLRPAVCIAKFDCPVAHQIFSLLGTDCENWIYRLYRQTDRQTDTVMGINPQWSGSDLKMKLRIHVYPPVYTMLTYLHLYWNRNMYSYWALKSNDTPEVGSDISLVAILIPNLFKYPHL